MTLYSTHFPPPDPARPEAPPILVPEGLSWWGLFLGWLVLLRPGTWLSAMLAGLVTLAVGAVAARVPGGWVLWPALNLAIALFAHDWQRWELRLGGCIDGPVVAGTDRSSALLRLIERRPDLIGQHRAPEPGGHNRAGDIPA